MRGRLLSGWVVAGLLAVLALGALRALLWPPRLEVAPQGLVLAHVTVVDPERGRRTDQTLTVRGERIERIEPSASAAPSGPLAGAFVLPGLIDLHVHHPPALAVGERELFALLFLAHGVTAVRDVGSLGGSLFSLRRRIAAGEVAGPRLFTCGPFLDGDPPLWPGARAPADPEAARRAVEELAAAGVDCVKVYNGVDRGVFRAIQATATAHGLPVVMHVPDRVPFPAIEDAEVQHLMGFADDWRQVTEWELEHYVARSLAQRLVHTPTLVAFARGAALARYPEQRKAPLAALLPSHYRDLLWNPERNPLIFGLAPHGFDELAVRLEWMKRLVARLQGAGVRVLAGTDTINPFVVPGAALQEELAHLVAAGLAPEQAWAAASRWAGEALGVPGLGTLREGAPADLAVFRADPTRDLAALGSLEAVVARGRLYSKRELDAALARQRAHFEGILPEAISRAATRVVLALAARSG